MVNKTIKIKLNVSNKLIYAIVTVFIIAAISVGVYAFNTNNPQEFGHSVGEIEGLEEAIAQIGTGSGSGTGSVVAPSIKELYIGANGKLCYKYEASTGCSLEQKTCNAITTTFEYSLSGVCLIPKPARNEACNKWCKEKVISTCKGDIFDSCYGGQDVKYNFGSEKSCESGKLKCDCKLNNAVTYQSEKYTSNCETQSRLCTFTKDIVVEGGTVTDKRCKDECSDKVACNGNTNLFGCTGSPTSVKFNNGVKTSTNTCKCKMDPVKEYLLEVETAGSTVIDTKCL